ncbi:MAG TPA: glycosyltransferase family 4 protein [Thermoleophilaceae bacterium]
MRVLIFHGYLLRGTGSNVYNASLARALVALGHEVHLLCQDRGAGELDFVDAVGTWGGGSLSVEALREPARCTAYLPPIGDVLPVYVADTYEGFTARPFPDLSDAELERYLDANAGAVRDVAEHARPDVALANHLIAGPAVLARGLGGSIPYAVKIHGSALEYVVRPHRERFLALAREGLAGAGGVLVGSRHTGESLWEVMDDPELPARTRLGPPGVDVHSFHPRPPAEAAERLGALADRLAGGAAAGWGGEAGAPDALRALDPRRDPIVVYVGKLIVSKGVDLLLAAWPLVTAEVPGARLLVVGFGTYREALARLAAALGAGDLAAARAIAARGRELEGGPAGELTYLSAFLDELDGERRERYVGAAASAFDGLHFTGRLEHGDLPDVLPACLAQVVPSTFPEAFGMVAVEGAACGALPLSASHSGLAEVTRALEPAVAPGVAPLLSFERGPGAVDEIAAKLVEWLTLPEAERDRARAQLSSLARERYGWEGVAESAIAAAQGRLEGLPEPRA